MDRIFHRPLLIVLLMTLVVLAVGHRALLIRQDNSPDTFFSADEQAQKTYHELLKTFGGDEVVLVQLRGKRLATPADAEAVRELARAMEGMPGVFQVLSPVPPAAVEGLDDEPLPLDPGELSALRRELEALDLFKNVGVYRPEIPAVGVAALVVMRGPESRPRLARALDELEAKLRQKGLKPLVAGLAPANAAIDRETRRSLGIFLPVVVGLCLLIGGVIFRSARAVIAMFLPVAGAVALGVGGLELAGETLNLVTGVMPPLVLAVGFAGAIHLVSHFASTCHQGLTPLQAIRLTIREKFVPTAFAYLTTATGFASLAISEVHAVRVLGLAAAGSLLCALVLVTVGTPGFILLLRPRLCFPEHRQRLLESAARFALRRRPWMLAWGALGVAFAVGGALRVTSTIDGMEMLAEDAPERVAYQTLEREGVGLGNIDLWIHVPAEDDAALLRQARVQAKLAEELERVPGVTGTVGVFEILRMVGYRMMGRAEIPPSLDALALLEPEQRRRLHRLLRLYWHPKRGFKLTVLSRTPAPEQVVPQRQAITAAAARHYPKVRVDLSGHFSMLIGTPGALVRTLGESLASTALVVTLLFFVFFRSPRLVFSGMVANLLPVGAAVGTMGWLGLPLDVATVMTGSVAFGIAVDDTFHYLYHRRKSGDILRAARVAGQGIVGTSLVIAGGFSALAASGFTPVVRFGLLTSLAVVFALGIDALLLPVLVGQGEDQKRRR